jgi:hypothetical protein
MKILNLFFVYLSSSLQLIGPEALTVLLELKSVPSTAPALVSQLSHEVRLFPALPLNLLNSSVPRSVYLYRPADFETS